MTDKEICTCTAGLPGSKFPKIHATDCPAFLFPEPQPGKHRYYGDRKIDRTKKHVKGQGGTVHKDGELSIEVDYNGVVVAVWFRCQALLFRVCPADAARAESMRRMYAKHKMPEITGLELRDPE